MKQSIKIGRDTSGRITVAFSYNPTHVAKVKTIEGYKWHPKELDEGYIKEYLLHLVDKERVSRSYHNQAVSALKFLYDYVLGMPHIVGKLARLKRERRLPVVLARQDVIRLLESVANIKHRALLMVSYSVGLRVSEVVKLRPIKILMQVDI